MSIYKHGQRVLGALRNSKAVTKTRSWLARLAEPPRPNYLGDRYVEYSFVAAHMPAGPGRALDFGCGPGNVGQNYMGLVAAQKGFDVTGLDVRPVDWIYSHPRLKFTQGDILGGDLRLEPFDLIMNVSVIEHIGLTGAYGVTESARDGDIGTMAVLRSLLKKGGIHLLTIPVGRDKVFYPWHRVYGKERLPKILDGWEAVKQEWWIKDASNRWIGVDSETALDRPVEWYSYGLGLFVLCVK